MATKVIPYRLHSTMTERRPRSGRCGSGAGLPPGARGGANGVPAAGSGEVKAAPPGRVVATDAAAAGAPAGALIWSSRVRTPEASQIPWQVPQRSMMACSEPTPPRSIGVLQRGHDTVDGAPEISGRPSIGASALGRLTT